MDMQKLMDAISNTARMTRMDYHLTLGKLIEGLESADPAAIVVYDDGGSPGDENSYRGYYSDLAFERSEKPKTVSDFLEQARNALGDTYEGYKGGDYVMGEDTPLWVAHYGNCGPAIISMAHVKDEVILTTKVMD